MYTIDTKKIRKDKSKVGRAITKWGAIVKSQILVSQNWKINGLKDTKIQVH